MSFNDIKRVVIEAFQRQNIHFFVVYLCLIMQMFTLGQAYRFFSYINLAIVLAYGFNKLRVGNNVGSKKLLSYLISIPIGFITIHFLAVENLIFIKEIRHILLATFLALGIWILAKKNPEYVKANILGFTIALIFIYVVVQAIALWWFNKPYGTAKNPHYLAMYSAITLIAAMYCFFRVSLKVKLLIGFSIILLSMFLLHSSSRPAWIGLIASALVTLIFLRRQARLFFGLSIAVILIGLTITNTGNFANRFDELLSNLNTEERVVIWQDTWKMQTQSSTKGWLFGHGLDAFEERFKTYSRNHLEKIDFNSPHNFILELLFISGVMGLLLAVQLLWLIYKNLIIGINRQNQYKNIYLVLMVVITSNLILVSITLPFFTSYNLNIIAIVAGGILFMREVSVRQMQ